MYLVEKHLVSILGPGTGDDEKLVTFFVCDQGVEGGRGRANGGRRCIS